MHLGISMETRPEYREATKEGKPKKPLEDSPAESRQHLTDRRGVLMPRRPSLLYRKGE
jgi:hypothetical protein